MDESAVRRRRHPLTIVLGCSMHDPVRVPVPARAHPSAPRPATTKDPNPPLSSSPPRFDPSSTRARRVPRLQNLTSPRTSPQSQDDAEPEKTKKMPKDKSLRAAVVNEYSDVDDDFDQNYYDYDEDEVEEGYIPGSSVESDASDDGDLLTKAKRRRKSRREWGKIPDDKLPRVAIVGRPNVGKSALFNRLTGTKRAIVYDQPGITRDRMYIRAFWGDTEFMMVDTGGLESLPGSPQDAPSVDSVGGVEILPGMVESQAALAVREASVLVFVTDGQKGLTTADEEIYGWIRKYHSEKPLLLAVNKCESTTKGEEQVLDFWSLGGATPLAASAISGTGTGELMDGLVAATASRPDDIDELRDADGVDGPLVPSSVAPTSARVRS